MRTVTTIDRKFEKQRRVRSIGLSSRHFPRGSALIGFFTNLAKHPRFIIYTYNAAPKLSVYLHLGFVPQCVTPPHFPVTDFSCLSRIGLALHDRLPTLADSIAFSHFSHLERIEMEGMHDSFVTSKRCLWSSSKIKNKKKEEKFSDNRGCEMFE